MVYGEAGLIYRIYDSETGLDRKGYSAVGDIFRVVLAIVDAAIRGGSPNFSGLATSDQFKFRLAQRQRENTDV